MFLEENWSEGMNMLNISRFIKAQQKYYNIALTEIKNGKKESHWMWYIFPQIKGLGYSETAKYYSIQDIDEVKAYLSNKYLYNNLVEICNELLKKEESEILEIIGYPDNLKLCSSMTLFYIVNPEEKVFKQIVDRYFNGVFDINTIRICNNSEN